MPRLVGPPWHWKVTWADAEVEVRHCMAGPWEGIYAATSRDGSASAKGETLFSALLAWWWMRQGCDVEIMRMGKKKPKEGEK